MFRKENSWPWSLSTWAAITRPLSYYANLALSLSPGLTSLETIWHCSFKCQRSENRGFVANFAPRPLDEILSDYLPEV